MEKRSFGLGIKENFYNENIFNADKANNKGYVLAKFSDLLSWARAGHYGLCHLGWHVVQLK